MKIEDVQTQADLMVFLVESGICAQDAARIIDMVPALKKRRASAAAKPRKPAKVTRTWPDDFVMTDVHADYAKARGFTHADVIRMWENFRNRNVARGIAYADWNAAWRTWVDKAVEYRNRDAGQPAGPTKFDRRL